MSLSEQNDQQSWYLVELGVTMITLPVISTLWDHRIHTANCANT